jgi:hypothetical protein
MTQLTKVLVVVGILLLVSVASAAITTGAATDVGSNNATIGCSGSAGNWWVQWGMTENVYWSSSEQGVNTTTYRIHESPLMGNTLFYYQCCDSTGCGALGTFLTASVTPLPTSSGSSDSDLGSMYENMTENGYNLPYIAANLVTPYLWNSNMPITIIFMLIFSPIFLGVWLRSRSALVALLLGFITGGFILTTNASNIGISMPVEVIAIAQAMVYIAFAGSVLYILHR